MDVVGLKLVAVCPRYRLTAKSQISNLQRFNLQSQGYTAKIRKVFFTVLRLKVLNPKSTPNTQHPAQKTLTEFDIKNLPLLLQSTIYETKSREFNQNL